MSKYVMSDFVGSSVGYQIGVKHCRNYHANIILFFVSMIGRVSAITLDMLMSTLRAMCLVGLGWLVLSTRLKATK